MVAPFTDLLRDETTHALLWNGPEEGVVKVEFVPRHRGLVLRRAHGQEDARGDQLLLRDERQHDIGQVRVRSLVHFWQSERLARVAAVRGCVHRITARRWSEKITETLTALCARIRVHGGKVRHRL